MTSVCVAGDTHLAQTLAWAAKLRGHTLREQVDFAHGVVFAARDVLDHEDTEAAQGVFVRALKLRDEAQLRYGTVLPLVLVSQVPPGTTRRWAADHKDVFYQVDTIRLTDALHRAVNPEQIVVGCADPVVALPLAYQEYLMSFECPVRRISYESAEFAKCAINYMLARQVEAATALAQAAVRFGADYSHVEVVLRADKRIGPHAYMRPGKINQHLKRDVDTLRYGSRGGD